MCSATPKQQTGSWEKQRSGIRDFLLFPGTVYNHRVHRENNNALCSLWLIFFAMIHLSYLIRIN